MKRSSPAVARIVSLLTFFAEHPHEFFTFSQITKSLKLSSATCHALLTGLVEGEFLYRNPDKTYVLGPAMIALGRTALENFSPLAVARKEMRNLADSLDVVCAALFRKGDEVVSLERAASLRHLGWASAPGQAHPIFPWVSVLMTTLPTAEIEAWMDKAKPPLTEQERGDTFRQIEFVRTYGFICAVNQESVSEAPRAESSRPPHLPVRFITDFDPKARYDLAFVVAPVLNAEGTVAFAMDLFGFDRVCNEAEVKAIADQLRNACVRVSTFMAGKKASSLAWPSVDASPAGA
jgi:DNA-binding IclR family transcriptional regulator